MNVRLHIKLFFLVIAGLGLVRTIRAEIAKAPVFIDAADGPGAFKDYAPRTAAEVLDAPREINPASAIPDGRPRAGISIDGQVFPGSWRKLSGSAVVPGGAGEGLKILEFEWVQKAGPKTTIPAEYFKNPELWLFLIKPGNYAFTFRAKNSIGWSTPAEIRFAVLQGRAYVTEQDGFQRTGSGERIVFPGNDWRQIAGPPAAIRGAENGVAVRPNDAGLYIFESPRLEEGIAERRGIWVPPAKDGTLGDRRPIARLPASLTGFAGRPVILDGSLSMDPDPEDAPLLTARWSTPDAGRGASLDAQAGLRAFFKAERPGMYAATLIVSDGRLESTPVTVFIEIALGDATNKESNTDGNVESFKDSADVMAHCVSLAIWPPEAGPDGEVVALDETGLQRAIQLFPKRCGIPLLVDKGVSRPEQFKTVPLAVEAIQTPLCHLLDGIARQTGTRYRREGDRAIWLFKPGDAFRDEKLEPVAAMVEGLSEKADASDLLAALQQFFRPVLKSRDGASISYEDAQRAIVAMLPATCGLRLREIAQVLREPAGIGFPPPEPPEKSGEQLRQVLAEKTVTLRGRFRLDRLLRQLAQSSGLSLGFDPKQFSKGIPYLKIEFENVALRQVLRDIVENAGFDGCSIEAPAGIWFYKGPRPFPTGELLWDTAQVRAYDLSALFAALPPDAASLLSGEAIAHAIRSRVYPLSWNDPGTLVFYHRSTQKLVVVHAPEAHRKVLDFLNDIRERGVWALGPAE